MTSALLIAAAAGAMVVQDILGTVMVVAESKNRPHLAAAMDTAGWIAQIVCTSVSVVTLATGSWGARIAVILAVSAANYIGTYSGTRLGHHLTREVKAE
jgi:hypothetical protein